MTIRKGDDWGVERPIPQGIVVVDSNRSLFDVVNRASLPGCIGLSGGDLARTVSASPATDRFAPGSRVVVAPVDLGVAVHDGGTHLFASHAVARRSWWRGQVLLAANAQFLGSWDVAPRSHPNDGYLDITEVSASMSWQQRFGAWRRLPTARHVPHPAVRTLRLRTGSWEFDRPLDLWLDGVRVGRTRTLVLETRPDAATVCF